MPRYILAVDQGTTGSTALLLDDELHVVARASREFTQHYPKPSWVEHDPEEIWRVTVETMVAALAKAQASSQEVAAIGITNQRETTVVWDRDTLTPIHNAIVWQDRRTYDVIDRLRDEHQQAVHKKTGLLMDPYFSATKIAWILDHVDGARKRAASGALAFGTIETWLLAKFTGGTVHKTDISNASRTMLMDLTRGVWDEQLLDLFGVPSELLPEITGNAELFGEVRGVDGIADGTPIFGMAGDQQSALFGQTCFEAGQAKCTFGTGAFLLMNTGAQPVMSTHRLITTAAWKIDGKTTYALEGSAFIAGALVQWLRDGLRIIKSAGEIEELAKSVPDSDGVVIIPSLAGLGAPYWNADARGVIWGITRGTTHAHIARAALEAIALQNVDILSAMEADLSQELVELRVDGGASANNLLMQMQSDFLDRKIVRPEILETTALGAALLAGLGSGIFKDLDDIRGSWRKDASFSPSMADEKRQEHLRLWQEGLSRV